MAPVLRVDGLQLAFGGLQVLKGASLDAHEGEITAIIGPNGAGKTALLNCISGIYRPNAGSIHFKDTALVGLSTQDIARCGIGRSFQNLELFPTLTVIENLLLSRDAHFRGGVLSAVLLARDLRHQEAREREAVERVIDFFELWPVRGIRAEDLPYGQQKIVGVARAFAMAPQLLLLDEPGSGLTRDEKENLARFLVRLKHDVQISTIWIEHDLQLVMDLADRVHVLHLGECIASGPPEEVCNDAQVVAAYLGT